MERHCKFVILYFLYVFISFSAQAQTSRIDSIRLALKSPADETVKLKLLCDLSFELVDVNPDSAEFYALRAVDLSKKQKNKKLEATALRNLGWSVSKKGESKESIPIYREGLAIAKQAEEKLIEGDIYRSLGVAHYHLSQYENALENYFHALDVYKEIKNDIKVAQVMNNIGNVYYFTKRSDAAETFYSQALEKYKKLNNEEGLAKQYGNLGLIYINNRDTLKAVEYSEKSLEYSIKIGNLSGIATSYVNLAYAYEIAEDYDKALKAANRALEIRQQIVDKKGVAIAISMLGNIYYKKADYKKAIEYLKQAKELTKEIGLTNYYQEILEYLGRSYLVNGNKREAEELFKRVDELEDSIYNIDFAERIAELETEYKTKEKDAQIQIQELSLKRRSTYLWAAAGFIVLLWVILGISYKAYLSKQKTNALLEKKNKEISHQKQEITDSINYAQTIQRAILPPEKLLQKYLPDSFVIFKPKDIVSGDFYWTLKTAAVGSSSQTLPTVAANSQLVFFAAVDCTGHGVPGAFMSIIGHNSLTRAVKDFKLTHPAEILDKLVELVTEALRAENQAEVKDGMDIALCCLDTEQMKLEYAGAYNPLYIIRKNEVLEFKADRQPIGSFEKRKPFTNHEIVLEKGDCIYVSSDGIADQFGGEKGKKLGSKRLKEWLVSVSHLPASEQYTRLKTDFENWQGNLEQTDDVTLIGVRV